MSSKPVAAAAKGVAKAPFIMGRKKVYLPNHLITLLRPKPGQSPSTATFKVPLTFNKLDFRDYLYNCYNVEVNSVRSFINQMRARQRSFTGFGGRWYRPRSQKMMIVDLKKPFVWPEAPKDEEKDPWDHKLFKTVEGGHKEDIRQAEERARGTPRLRSDADDGPSRDKLRTAAWKLLSGKQKWVPGTHVEVEK